MMLIASSSITEKGCEIANVRILLTDQYHQFAGAWKLSMLQNLSLEHNYVKFKHPFFAELDVKQLFPDLVVLP